jgi:hypothetical protein
MAFGDELVTDVNGARRLAGNLIEVNVFPGF